MTEHIRDRINRRLDALPEERLYQVLDYVEFLESKYAARQAASPNAFQKFAEGIEDKMRAGRVSASTIAETMGLLNRAVGVLNGVAAAGKSVAADLANAAQRVSTVVADATAQAGVAGTTPPGQVPAGQTPPAQTASGQTAPGPLSPPAAPVAPPVAPPTTESTPPAGPPAGAAGGPTSGEPTS